MMAAKQFKNSLAAVKKCNDTGDTEMKKYCHLGSSNTFAKCFAKSLHLDQLYFCVNPGISPHLSMCFGIDYVANSEPLPVHNTTVTCGALLFPEK